MKTEFTFNAPSQDATGSVLHEEHLKRVSPSRLAAFAGYLMPLWFSSIQEEHHAVRSTAGLFDCTHMGVFSLKGEDAEGFIKTVSTNQVDNMVDGQAQYGYLLDADGAVLDDIIVYKRTDTDFLMVVNAANAAKIKAWFKGLLADDHLIDPANPDHSVPFKPAIEDLGPASDSGLVDIALQGPASMDLVAQLFDGDEDTLRALKPFRFIDGHLQGIPCVISRSGYTGSAMGFELLVNPKEAQQLWNLLLDRGSPLGILPCGLGARDSLRIQAGLPLYGHELAGQFEITPIEAGYGWAVKLDKAAFIGKAAMVQNKAQATHQVVRVALPGGRGVRPVREQDPILDAQGTCQGWILSSAAANDQQVALAYVNKTLAAQETPVGVYYLARSQGQIKKGRLEQVTEQETVKPDLEGQIVSRFEKF